MEKKMKIREKNNFSTEILFKTQKNTGSDEPVFIRLIVVKDISQQAYED